MSTLINTSVQKGGIAGLQGCLEHTAVISQIKESVQSITNLATGWLDLEKAHPNVPHQLIRYAMDHCHIPQDVSGLVKRHFCKTKTRFSVGKGITHWQDVEKGIMAGCTTSVTVRCGHECDGGRVADRIQMTSVVIWSAPSPFRAFISCLWTTLQP